MPTSTPLPVFASALVAGALTTSLVSGPAPAAAAAGVLAPTAAGLKSVGLKSVGLKSAVPIAGKSVGQGQDRRRMMRYVVRRGDTATGLAVRYHAWTSELLALNGLTYASQLHIGQRLRIPVVPARLRDAKPGEAPRRARSAVPRKPKPRRSVTHAEPARAKVARVVAATARRHGVDPQLALAVSWQEAGWQMRQVSWAGAIGAMQVLPTTGVWMSLYAGRRLRLKRLHDNALAGVLLLSVLDDHTRKRRRMIGAYYQGLGAVREHGLYPETKRYVANVLAIKARLEQGRAPA